jgi:hypothetical protein
MVVDKSKMLLTFAHPRISRETQEAQGRQHFKGSEPFVVHVGKLPKLAIDVARVAREGDTVWLWALPMIVVSRKKAGVGMQAQITLVVKTIAAAKATLVEGCTGRTTATRAQAAAMIDEAHKIIVHGGKRLPKTNGKPGRKPLEWPSPEVEAEWRRKWRSKNFPSDAAVIREAEEAGISGTLIRKLGPSGRNTR